LKTYVVELYLPNAATDVITRAALRARRAGEALADEGVEVRYVRSLFIPEDGTCFHVFEASSAKVVGEASRRARLEYDRIVEAVQ
jgi:uncharacterized protein DUF4242